MEGLLANDVDCQHRLEQANDRMNHCHAEEVEKVDKTRKLIPSPPNPKTTMGPSGGARTRWTQT